MAGSMLPDWFALAVANSMECAGNKAHHKPNGYRAILPVYPSGDFYCLSFFCSFPFILPVL